MCAIHSLILAAIVLAKQNKQNMKTQRVVIELKYTCAVMINIARIALLSLTKHVVAPIAVHTSFVSRSVLYTES